MTNTMQNWNRISRMRLATTAALTLAAVLVLAVIIITTQSAQAQTLQNPTFETLKAFDFANGQSPVASLVQGTNGDLYGTTSSGGAGEQGTVFRINPSTAGLTTLDSVNGFPVAGLVLGSNGKFYGTMQFGYNGAVPPGDSPDTGGELFSVTAGGTLKSLFSFCSISMSPCPSGIAPAAPLVQAIDGNFYGTASGGGANNYGTVFSITPAGTPSVLYSFDGTDGANPVAGLIQAPDGTFYGTTESGGANSAGTVFSFTFGGPLTTLYSFCSQSNCADGANPAAGLVLASNGNLYGTTLSGGTVNAGTIFSIPTSGGTPTTLYSFCSQSGCADGANPFAGLILGQADGNLYGTTTGGGANGSCTFDGPVGVIGFPANPNDIAINGCGTIFEISPTGGPLTTLYSFCSQSNCADGKNPVAGLFQATDGLFYGTTVAGGVGLGNRYPENNKDQGTVFSLNVGLGEFVETVPTSGIAGTAVTILGTNLTNATSVAFNGTTAAEFTVVSSSEITTKVPAGATSGFVTLNTPTSGTLTSNQQFLIAGAALLPATTVFATEADGTASPAKTITLFNYAASTMSITSAGAIGGTNAPDFSITGGTCVGLSSLPATSNCTYTITFTPSLVGAETATLSVSDSFGTETAALKGTGTP